MNSLWRWRTTPFSLYPILASLAPLNSQLQVSCWYCSSAGIMGAIWEILGRGPKELTYPLLGRPLSHSLKFFLPGSSRSAEVTEYPEVSVSCQFLHCTGYFRVSRTRLPGVECMLWYSLTVWPWTQGSYILCTSIFSSAKNKNVMVGDNISIHLVELFYGLYFTILRKELSIVMDTW